MNSTGFLSDFKNLILNPRRLFAFFDSYEKPNLWVVYKVIWGFFVLSVITQAIVSYQAIAPWSSFNFSFEFNGVRTFDFVSPIFKSFRPILIWVEIWSILLHPFFAFAKILSWAALTFLLLDLSGARPERIGFSKLILVFCLVNWLQIFQTISIFTWVWIFYLSVFAVERIFLASKAQAIFAVAGSFWIGLCALYLLSIAGLGGLFALF